MTVKLLTAHHLEFQSLKGGCTGSSESTLVKMQHCWKSYAAAQLLLKDGTNVSSNAVLIGAPGLKTALSSLETIEIIYDGFHHIHSLHSKL